MGKLRAVFLLSVVFVQPYLGNLRDYNLSYILYLSCAVDRAQPVC